jgi:predicted Zn-dependent protease
MSKKLKFLLILFFIFLLPTQNSYAQRKITIIRDTEIEDFLYEISRPIFITAGLNPEQIKFYIIQDSSINAFVSGGQNIFVHTGTLSHFDEPDALLGIIAHETGHITGGHLARIGEEYRNQQKIAIGGVAVAMLAMLAGSAEGMQAGLFGGMHISQQNILHYTRTQEKSADQLAIKFLTENNLSPEALLKSMEEFKRDELGIDDDMEYYITHPLSKSRVEHIKANLNPKLNNDWFNYKYGRQYNLIKAKIIGYTKSQNMVLKEYPKLDKTDYGLYARSISYSLRNQKRSLGEINNLIARNQNNPYFLETRGSIMFNFGKIDEAIKDYQKANLLLPNKSLIQIALSMAIVKGEKSDLYNEAIFNLEKALELERDNLQAWKLLAEVYYKVGKMDLSYLSLAEYFLRIGNREKVMKNLKLAKDNTKDIGVLIRIEDLKNFKK